jgi:putative ABC transport system permease protein
MRFRRALGPSLRALLAHKARAGLALTSIAVAVSAVVVTSAVGIGAQEEALRRMRTMGTNLLVVRPAQVKNLAARKTMRGSVTSLKTEDYEAIANLSFVAAAAPGAEGRLRVKAANTATLTKVLGTTSAFTSVRQFRLQAGRFIDASDDHLARRVVVLGASVARTLFKSSNPLGQNVRIRGVPYEVIGVLEAKGVLADGSDEDNQVLVPIRTALRRIFNTTWLNAIFVSVRDMQNMNQAVDEITRLLRLRHRLQQHRKGDDFAIQNTAKYFEVQQQTAKALTLLSTGLAAVALVVGGTGILALMLLSLKERTSEIGLRMAVGATPRNILAQFLLEAALLALGGWLTGMLIGALGSAALAFGTNWQIAVPAAALLASLATTLTIGLGFGAFPARKASLLPPLQALLAK